MGTTVDGFEGKGQETNGNHRQAAFGFLAAVRDCELAPHEFIAKASEVGVMRYAAQRSGQDDYELAAGIHISPGYFSKVLRGTAGLHGRRLVNYMLATGSLAPLQWLAQQVGCEVVPRDSRAAEVAGLRARLLALERAA